MLCCIYFIQMELNPSTLSLPIHESDDFMTLVRVRNLSGKSTAIRVTQPKNKNLFIRVQNTSKIAPFLYTDLQVVLKKNATSIDETLKVKMDGIEAPLVIKTC
jgi:hypothetical protein